MLRAMYKVIISVILLAVLFPLRAQVASYHFDGFENGQTNSGWMLNVGPNGTLLSNKWYISSFEPYMGDSCLLISNDSGATASYENVKNTAVAYKDYTLLPGSYDLSFMWRCIGEEGGDGLYVCWVPASVVINSSLAGLPNAVKNYAIKFTSSIAMLSSSSQWSEAVSQVTVTGTAASTYRLYFVWDNNAANHTYPSACVDNIQLTSAGCTKPSNIKCGLSGNRVSVQWQGNASSYDVMYRAYGSSETVVINDISNSSLELTDMPQGLYDIFVRANCGDGDTSLWVSYRNLLIYQSDINCIDFINFNGQNTKCQIGSFERPNSETKIVDMGADNRLSRHTMNYLPGVVDTWSTEGRLSTIAPGEIVSVRLGNPENGSEQESVTYIYTVGPNDNTILLLKYAVVFEEPGHEEENVFKLEILDAWGNLLPDNGKGCSLTEFHAKDDPTWQKSRSESNSSISWKDWTTIGVNLTPYRGQTIQIRVSTFDCGWGGHYTYAYYSLSCSKAELTGFSCGDVSEFSISAPEGFDYKWYRPEDPTNILSTDREFSIPSSQADTFYCDVIFKENPDCFFTLPAYLVPRSPLSSFASRWQPENCENKLFIENLGGIVADGRLTQDKCDYIEWRISDSKTGADTIITDSVNITLNFPDYGDTIDIRLVSGISNNACTDTMEIKNFVIPPIGPTDTVLVVEVCQGQLPYIFSGNKYYKSGRYSNRDFPDQCVSFAGCDSIVTLDLTVIDKIESEIFDTICQGDTAWLSGRPYVNPGDYLATVKSVDGCDSVITLHLHVFSAIDIEVDSIEPVCADAAEIPIHFVVNKGDIDRYSLRFEQKAKDCGFEDKDNLSMPDDKVIKIPMPENMPVPDSYKVVLLFSTPKCGDITFSIDFLVLYPTGGIMEQKWNDVISLLNSEHNYGQFKYSYYQWYKNDKQISGANSSYLYIGGEGEQFDVNDKYSVELVREGETRKIMSCYLTPVDRSALTKSDYVVINQVETLQKIAVPKSPEVISACWYTVSGQIVQTAHLDPDIGFVVAPASPGIYLLKLVYDDTFEIHKVVVK